MNINLDPLYADITNMKSNIHDSFQSYQKYCTEYTYESIGLLIYSVNIIISLLNGIL